MRRLFPWRAATACSEVGAGASTFGAMSTPVHPLKRGCKWLMSRGGLPPGETCTLLAWYREILPSPLKRLRAKCNLWYYEGVADEHEPRAEH